MNKNLKEKGYIDKTFNLPPDMVATLEEMAQEKNLSLNEVALRCLDFAIEEMYIEDEEKLEFKKLINKN